MIGGEIVGKYKDEKEGERYDITARLIASERDHPEDIDALWVRSSTGELVRMKDVRHIQTGKGPTVIMHYNRQRAATLFAGTEKTKPMAEAMNDLNAIVKKNVSPEISTRYVGMADAMLDAFKNIAFALVIAVIMVYMILASQFESFVHPFTIMFSLARQLDRRHGAVVPDRGADKHLQPHRHHHADGSGDEECDPAGGLYHYPQDQGHVAGRGAYEGRAGPAPADRHDDGRHGIRHAADSAEDGGGGRDTGAHGDCRHRRAYNIDAAHPGCCSRRLYAYR